MSDTNILRYPQINLKQLALIPDGRHQIFYNITDILKDAFPEKIIFKLNNSDCGFQHWHKYYQKYGGTEFLEIDSLYDDEHDVEVHIECNENNTVSQIQCDFLTGWWKIKQNNETFDVIRICCGKDEEDVETWVITENEETVLYFLQKIKDFVSTQPIEEVCVYQGGIVHDQQLFKDIKNATFDNLCLEENFLLQLKSEVSHFLNSKSIYEKYKLPWKRGIILMGPPGNGKTHFLKALINHSAMRCIYVKEWINTAKMFFAFRSLAPCIVVFEDLDSLVKSHNLSSFLNEMDGFANNNGLLFIATTNHPERIDSALLKRPSRFDRIYEFKLPSFSLRTNYFKTWNEQVDHEMKISEKEIKEIAKVTEGLSFASLKELWLSSMLEFVQHPVLGNMISCLKNNAIILKTQPTIHRDDDED